MSNRQEAIQKMAKYMVETEDTSARKVAAQLATIYEQTVGLRPDVSTLKTSDGFVRAERWTTNWGLVVDEN